MTGEYLVDYFRLDVFYTLRKRDYERDHPGQVCLVRFSDSDGVEATFCENEQEARYQANKQRSNLICKMPGEFNMEQFLQWRRAHRKKRK
jgi:hypothetical protein